VAESLRKVLSEIDAGISKLEREQAEKREAATTNYGPDRAYFALKDKCIEKRIEVRHAAAFRLASALFLLAAALCVRRSTSTSSVHLETSSRTGRSSASGKAGLSETQARSRRAGWNIRRCGTRRARSATRAQSGKAFATTLRGWMLLGLTDASCLYRSVLVHLECGDGNEIVSVDEPSTCVYEMTVRSPLACTAQVLAKAQEDVAFWTQAQ